MLYVTLLAAVSGGLLSLGLGPVDSGPMGMAARVAAVAAIMVWVNCGTLGTERDRVVAAMPVPVAALAFTLVQIALKIS